MFSRVVLPSTRSAFAASSDPRCRLHPIRLIILLLGLSSLVGNSRAKRTYQTMGNKRCTVVELQKCMNFLQAVTEGNDSTLPSSHEELKKTCDDLSAGVKCLDKHSSSCFNHQQTMVFEDLLNPAKIFITQLCDGGKTAEDFMKYAVCYKNISTDRERCASKYQDAVTASANTTENQNPEKSIKMSCCSLRNFIQCKYDYVGQDCGTEAEHFMRRHLGPITHPLLDRHCAAYTFGSHACADLRTVSHADCARNSSVFLLCLMVALVTKSLFTSDNE